VMKNKDKKADMEHVSGYGVILCSLVWLTSYISKQGSLGLPNLLRLRKTEVLSSLGEWSAQQSKGHPYPLQGDTLSYHLSVIFPKETMTVISKATVPPLTSSWISYKWSYTQYTLLGQHSVLSHNVLRFIIHFVWL
jgi:hypothetical protein